MAELTHAISEYLCSECREPWYVKLGTTDDYCFNPKCRIHDRTQIFPNITAAEPLNSEMKQEEARLLVSLQGWKKAKLLEFTYNARFQEIANLWKTAKVKIGQIMVLDEFLVRVQTSRTGMRAPSLADFRRLLSQFANYRGRLNLIEDIEYGRFLVSSSGETFVLKYWTTVQELFRNFGLINEESKELEGTFRYQDVDAEAKDRKQPKVFDFGAYFERMFDFSSTLRYGFEIYNSDRLRHNYNPTTVEIAALLALGYSCRRPVETQPPGWLEGHLSNNRLYGVDATHFIQKYVQSGELASIAIQIDGKTMFDWFTIVFYSHYLIAKNEIQSPQATDTGAARIREAKERASRFSIVESGFS